MCKHSLISEIDLIQEERFQIIWTYERFCTLVDGYSMLISNEDKS